MKSLEEEEFRYTKEESISLVKNFLLKHPNIICHPNRKLFNDTLTNYGKSSLTGEDGIFTALFDTKVTHNSSDKLLLTTDLVKEFISANKKNINSLKQTVILEPIVIVKLVDDIRDSIKENYKKGTNDKKGKVHNDMQQYLKQIYHFITHNPERISVPNKLTTLASLAIAYAINIGVPDGTIVAQAHIEKKEIRTNEKQIRWLMDASNKWNQNGYIPKELSDNFSIVKNLKACLTQVKNMHNQIPKIDFIEAMNKYIFNKKT